MTINKKYLSLFAVMTMCVLQPTDSRAATVTQQLTRLINEAGGYFAESKKLGDQFISKSNKQSIGTFVHKIARNLQKLQILEASAEKSKQSASGKSGDIAFNIIHRMIKAQRDTTKLLHDALNKHRNSTRLKLGLVLQGLQKAVDKALNARLAELPQLKVEAAKVSNSMKACIANMEMNLRAIINAPTPSAATMLGILGHRLNCTG